MKKIITCILLVLCVFTLTGCQNNNQKAMEQKDEIIEKIKEYHLNRFKLSSLMIPYDEYNNNAGKILSSKYPREKDSFFMIDGISYTEDKLATLSDDDIKELREKLYGAIKRMFGEIDYGPFVVSKVYDHSTLNFKYVFVKSPQVSDTLGNRIIYTRYTLHKDMGEWRILEIKRYAWGESRDGETGKIRLESFGGEPIDFVAEEPYPDFPKEYYTIDVEYRKRPLVGYHTMVMGNIRDVPINPIKGTVTEVISSDENIVKVSHDYKTVTAVSPGNAKIIVKTIYKDEILEFPTIITVLSEEQVSKKPSPRGVAIGPDRIQLLLGKTKPMHIHVFGLENEQTDNNERIFSVEVIDGDTNIATINEKGTVIGINKGRTVLSFLVKIKDSEGVEFLKEIEVTVK